MLGTVQILLDTIESPALTLHTCTGPVHMPTDEELATSTVYRYMQRAPPIRGLCAQTKLYTVSGSYLEAVLMTILSRFNDTRTATSTTVIDGTEEYISFRAQFPQNSSSNHR